ncbi:hypothetical protein M758_12G156500 [Ceratodon purpureus]|uniref:Secreted protein n=1 Tax=Ceratodon purpureus TaxID=3225 RepID=A0A8T0G882_CERPU|nr:hypothetical protein KC19_12G154000 [Ceratodon purpureus]KAG0599498.1 hypothetical protein M758_12G156500 [Ceratodon purpureus]
MRRKKTLWNKRRRMSTTVMLLWNSMKTMAAWDASHFCSVERGVCSGRKLSRYQAQQKQLLLFQLHLPSN